MTLKQVCSMNSEYVKRTTWPADLNSILSRHGDTSDCPSFEEHADGAMLHRNNPSSDVDEPSLDSVSHTETTPANGSRRQRKPIILVPTDLSPASLAAAEHGLRIAQDNAALLLLVHVIHLNISPYGPANPRWLKTALCHEAMEKTAPFMSRAGNAGVTALCAIEEGSPSTVITKLAARWKASMIVLASHRRGFLSRLFGKGTLEHVISNARCPVVVCPAISQAAA
jgi:nucleotide-binding universal stress UspA family protein